MTEQFIPDVPCPGEHMKAELLSQPDVWRRAVEQEKGEEYLPSAGKRVAVVGCGTSWFMAQAYAAARESLGQGVTDAFAASEVPDLLERNYDALITITRSGTTTEVLLLLNKYQGKIPTIAIVGNTDSPIRGIVDVMVGLPYADERSVVQTRFATSALVYLLSSLGQDMTGAISNAEEALQVETDPELLDAEQFTFLGVGWTVGLAHEAGLKMREAVQGWTESYPALEYRHGPISIAAPRRVVWLFGEEDLDLTHDVRATGARWEFSQRHPLADLARIHKITLERALDRGLNPDTPRNLTRSVILEG